MQLNFNDYQGGKIFNDQFGTVRLYEPERFITGNVFEILVKHQSMGFAKVVAERSFYFKQIRDVLAFMETGKPTSYLAAMLQNYYGGKERSLTPDTTMVHVILQYTERDLDNQRTLITDWWQRKIEHQPKPIEKTIFS